jgi:hypothetical protein
LFQLNVHRLLLDCSVPSFLAAPHNPVSDPILNSVVSVLAFLTTPRR